MLCPASDPGLSQTARYAGLTALVRVPESLQKVPFLGLKVTHIFLERWEWSFYYRPDRVFEPVLWDWVLYTPCLPNLGALSGD